MYKLSPSYFAYLYEECKYCFCLKVKQNIDRPSMPMPGVFSALNTRLQGSLVGNDLQSLSKDLPAGFVESQEGFVQSKPIPGTQVYLKGKYDLLVRLPDKTYLVVDFKISQPQEDKISKYQSQLQSYKCSFENPAEGEPKIITKMGLIVMYPDTVKFESGKAILDFPPHWLEVPSDSEAFLKFITGISDLLEGPMPPENPNCKWCSYRHLGEKLSQPQTEDIPF